MIKDKEEKECVFCLGEKNLVKNTICECKYNYHVKCFIEWVERSKSCQCVMCQKEISPKHFSNNSGEAVRDVNLLSHQDYLYECKEFFNNIIHNDMLLNINPAELKTNINRDFSIRNISFNFEWEIPYEELNLGYKKVGITNVINKGIIYYRILINDTLLTNVHVQNIVTNRFRHEEVSRNQDTNGKKCAIIICSILGIFMIIGFIIIMCLKVYI